jgi:hypothetical protein
MLMGRIRMMALEVVGGEQFGYSDSKRGFAARLDSCGVRETTGGPDLGKMGRKRSRV